MRNVINEEKQMNPITDPFGERSLLSMHCIYNGNK